MAEPEMDPNPLDPLEAPLPESEEEADPLQAEDEQEEEDVSRDATWIKIVRTWTIMTREKAQLCKKEVQNYTIQDVAGMNMGTAVAYLTPRLNALLETREIDPADLYGFLKSLHKVYPTDNELHLPWWSEIHNDIIQVFER